MSARQQWAVDDNAGWVLLLPARRGADRTLVIESQGRRHAEPAAFWFESVTALTAGAVAQTTDFVNGAQVAQSDVSWRPGARMPYADGVFSQVVVRLAGSGAGGAELAALLPELRRVLGQDGCLYVDVDNPWSFQAGGARGMRRASLRRALANAGFTRQRSWALILENQRLAEVVPASGYRASRNAWRGRERVKEWLLGPRSQRLFAPAYAFLVSRGELPASGYAGLPSASAAADTEPAQFLVNAAKCFVRFTPAGHDAIPLLCVVPTRIDTVARRRTELAMLKTLAARGLSINRLLPRVWREARFRDRPVFEYEAIDGSTIDLLTPDFDALMERAFETLIEFNRDSLERVRLDAAGFEVLAGAALDVAARRYPSAADAVARLAGALRAQLVGRELPLVWLHGDYKLENLIFGNARHDVRAIIDWELSAPRGLPLVDLFYLLAYREITTDPAATDILDVCAANLLPARWGAHSESMLRRYLVRFPGIETLNNAALAVFLVHHVAVRFTYEAGDNARQQQIETLMNSIAARLAPAPARQSA